MELHFAYISSENAALTLYYTIMYNYVYYENVGPRMQ